MPTNITNQELVEKAVITADTLAASGKLNPAQSNKFIDYVVSETMLTNNARIVRFRNETLEIDKIGLGKRAAVPKSEGIDPGVRRGVSTSKISLTPKEIMVPVEIGDTFGEINIEGQMVEETIMKMFGKKTGNDVETLAISGNKLGPAALQSDLIDNGDSSRYVKDTYLGLVDGWQTVANSGHIVDAGGANVGLSIFSQALRAMPNKFRRNVGDLRFFMSPDLAQIYYEKLSTRATNMGDMAANGGTQKPWGVPIVPVPLWDFLPSVTEHVTLNGTTAVSLLHGPVQNVVVTPTTIGSSPIDAYVVTTDYTLDAAAGTIARTGGGAIGDGDTVKVTYQSNPQIILTHMTNFIMGIGRDVRIEKDRDIYRGVNQYAISLKVDVNFEETDAIVKVKNIGQGV